MNGAKRPTTKGIKMKNANEKQKPKRSRSLLLLDKNGGTNMNNFIALTKHETAGANLTLDRKKVTVILLNIDKIDFITFDDQFGNGYGEKLPRLEIHIAGTEIILYRDDAISFFQESRKTVVRAKNRPCP